MVQPTAAADAVALPEGLAIAAVSGAGFALTARAWDRVTRDFAVSASGPSRQSRLTTWASRTGMTSSSSTLRSTILRSSVVGQFESGPR